MNGEELSAKGMALLNDVLSQNGDPMVVSPIVIEGYWSNGAPADQLRGLPQPRHAGQTIPGEPFQLDPGNTGVVALRNEPPKGMERAAWDGICIVVLRRG